MMVLGANAERRGLFGRSVGSPSPILQSMLIPEMPDYDPVPALALLTTSICRVRLKTADLVETGPFGRHLKFPG